MTRTTCLARVACYGSVCASPSGRLQVRYGSLTVKLRPHEYAIFAAEIRARADRGGSLEMRYGRETLRLRPAELRRFAQMIQEAWSRLMDVQFARLVASGVSPEAPESEVDSTG